MREALEAERTPRLLSREALPLFSMFFLWGFGTGAFWVSLPLLAYDLTGFVFAAGATFLFAGIPQLTTPLIGVLVDRMGRRRVIVAGAVVHGGATVMQAFTDSYSVFLGLAFISGFGAAAWLIGSTTLLADFTRVANRGRGVALRSVAERLGLLAGPLAGGAVAVAFDFRALFIIIAATRVLIAVITLLLVRETRPAPASVPEAEAPPRRLLRLDVSLFLTRGFLALIVVAFALAPVEFNLGALRAELSERAYDAGRLFAIGSAIGVSSLITMLVAMPVGAAVDRWGRKAVLLTGLATLAAVMFLAPWANGLLIAMVVLGVVAIGNLTTGIALETHAMDLAPREKRGYFLGTWLAMKTLIELAWLPLVGALAVGVYATGATVTTAWSGVIFGVVLLGAAAFLAVSRTPRP